MLPCLAGQTLLRLLRLFISDIQPSALLRASLALSCPPRHWGPGPFLYPGLYKYTVNLTSRLCHCRSQGGIPAATNCTYRPKKR
jgi:hypothetical protein